MKHTPGMTINLRPDTSTIQLRAVAVGGFTAVVCAFLLIAILPISFVAKRLIQGLEGYSSEIVQEVAKTGEGIAQELAGKFLRQKARDIADKVSLFAASRPTLDFSSPALVRVAIEKIEESGYSAVYDCKTFITLAHPNPRIVGSDGREIGRRYPDWFRIWNSECQESEGAYTWQDAQGHSQQKYMVVTPVRGTPYMVAATMPLAEFQKPSKAIQSLSRESLRRHESLMQKISRQAIWISCLAALSFILILLFIGRRTWSRFVSFISSIRNFSNELASDNYEARFPKLSRVAEFQSLQKDLELMKEKIVGYQEASRLAASRESTLELSTQVAHDIRSPLAALRMASGDLSGLPEDQRVLIRMAVTRINDIANTLLNQVRAQTHAPLAALSRAGVRTDLKSTGGSETDLVGPKTKVLLSSFIETVLAEKRTQYRELGRVRIESHFDLQDFGLFILANECELRRVISNLVDNAVEATPGVGRILITAERQGDLHILSIQDEGAGIAPELLPRLGERGETHGKKGGSGLGLFHAKRALASWNAELTISSAPGRGTRAQIHFPACEPPDWFTSEIRFELGSKIVIVDDDESIHLVWQRRFSAMVEDGACNLTHLSGSAELKTFVCNQDKSSGPILYLVDQELLGSPQTGLDLIEELGVRDQAILVTSRWMEDTVQRRCTDLNLKMIPKAVAGFIGVHPAHPPALGSGLRLESLDKEALGNQMSGFRSLLHSSQEISPSEVLKQESSV